MDEDRIWIITPRDGLDVKSIPLTDIDQVEDLFESIQPDSVVVVGVKIRVVRDEDDVRIVFHREVLPFSPDYTPGVTVVDPAEGIYCLSLKLRKILKEMADQEMADRDEKS